MGNKLKLGDSDSGEGSSAKDEDTKVREEERREEDEDEESSMPGINVRAKVLDWDQPLPEWVGKTKDGGATWPQYIMYVHPIRPR